MFSKFFIERPIFAAVISIGILLIWQFVYEQPRMEKMRQAAEQEKAEQLAQGKLAQPGTPPTPRAAWPSASLHWMT